MSSQYGELWSLTDDIRLPVWGTPTHFNGFRVLAALLHGTLVFGRQPNFAALNRRRHLYLAGPPSRCALAHILVYAVVPFCISKTSFHSTRIILPLWRAENFVEHTPQTLNYRNF